MTFMLTHFRVILRMLFSTTAAAIRQQTLLMQATVRFMTSARKWSAYSDVTNPTQATSSTKPTQATQPATSSGNAKPIYCQNDAGWSNVYCHMWNSSTENNAAWPGKPMTEIGDNVWSYTPNKAYKNVIFSSGSNKSNDLTVGSGDLYNNKTNTWSVYDTSDIQVTSYKADPSKTIAHRYSCYTFNNSK